MTLAIERDAQQQSVTRTAADVMSAPVVTVSVRDSLWTAWGLIYRSGYRHLVVVDGTRCAGVLDDRRMLAEWPIGPLGPHRRTVGDVITRRTHCVLPATPVAVVSTIMLDDRIDAVPVVNQRGEVVGLVTATDLIRELTRQ